MLVCRGVVLKELAARIGARVRGWRDKEIDRELRREVQEERIDKTDKREGRASQPRVRSARSGGTPILAGHMHDACT